VWTASGVVRFRPRLTIVLSLLRQQTYNAIHILPSNTYPHRNLQDMACRQIIQAPQTDNGSLYLAFEWPGNCGQYFSTIFCVVNLFYLFKFLAWLTPVGITFVIWSSPQSLVHPSPAPRLQNIYGLIGKVRINSYPLTLSWGQNVYAVGSIVFFNEEEQDIACYLDLI